jgi:hypothetical protein
LRDFSTDDIVNTEDADKGQVISFDILDILVFRVVVVCAASVSIEVTVGEGNCSESKFGVGINDGLDLGNGVVIKGNNLALLVSVVLAAFEDHLRGALDHKSLAISIILVGIADDSRHSLSV